MGYKIAESPVPSEDEEEESEDEDDGFGPKKPAVDPDDPVAQAKAAAEKAQAMVRDKIPSHFPSENLRLVFPTKSPLITTSPPRVWSLTRPRSPSRPRPPPSSLSKSLWGAG